MSIRSIRYRRPARPTWDVELERSLVVPSDAHAGRWNWAELFGRDAPVQVEIGFGKGRFLLAAAQRWPERNWFGIEYAAPCVALVAERAAKRGITNVRLMRGAAEEIVPKHIPDASVEAYHIYFPDPWPKKRHHKRRLIKPPFAAELLRTLAAGGYVHVATDFRDYFDQMLSVLQEAGLPLEATPEEPPEEPFRTNYEMKCLAQRKPVYRARFRKDT